jgi:16S rRNA (guanine966-N2)-methyltransferase
MRIISGKHKNKKIYTSIKNVKTIYRPTSSKTRSAIFNVLAHGAFVDGDIITGKVYADICCGSGSFGLEALSRGAAFAYFIDADSKQTKLARTNIEGMQEAENSRHC